jgi:hypothetical protein
MEIISGIYYKSECSYNQLYLCSLRALNQGVTMSITEHVSFAEAANASPDLSVLEVSPAIVPYGYRTPEVNENGIFTQSKPIDGYVVEATDEPLAAWRMEELVTGKGIVVFDSSFGRLVIRKFTPNLVKNKMDPNHFCCLSVRPVYNTSHTGMCFDRTKDRRYLLEVIGGHGLMFGKVDNDTTFETKIMREIESRMSSLWFIDAVVPASEYLYSTFEEIDRK